MSVIETLYPDGDLQVNAWRTEGGGTVNLYASVDDPGAHDGDTTYVRLANSVTGTLTSDYEASLQNPAASWKGIPAVGTGGVWAALKDAWVGSGGTWKRLRLLAVRSGAAWKTLVPEVTVRAVAKRIPNLVGDPISGSLALRVGATTIASTSLSLADNAYVETVLTLPASDLIGYDPTDLRVLVSGSVTTSDIDLNGPSELRVTQLKVELSD
jgi:hypothetical protein